jgi:hypothetical protein
MTNKAMRVLAEAVEPVAESILSLAIRQVPDAFVTEFSFKPKLSL